MELLREDSKEENESISDSSLPRRNSLPNSNCTKTTNLMNAHNRGSLKNRVISNKSTMSSNRSIENQGKYRDCNFFEYLKVLILKHMLAILYRQF